MIVTACYLCGCVPNAKLIDGPQGRYFLPLLPLVLLTLSNRAIRVQADPRVLLSLAAAAGAAILLVSVAAFVRRYYLPAILELRVEPAALAVAGVLTAIVVVLARWRWGTTEAARWQDPHLLRAEADPA
jgi:hypothetical protein